MLSKKVKERRALNRLKRTYLGRKAIKELGITPGLLLSLNWSVFETTIIDIPNLRLTSSYNLVKEKMNAQQEDEGSNPEQS